MTCFEGNFRVFPRFPRREIFSFCLFTMTTFASLSDQLPLNFRVFIFIDCSSCFMVSHTRHNTHRFSTKSRALMSMKSLTDGPLLALTLWFFPLMLLLLTLDIPDVILLRWLAEKMLSTSSLLVSLLYILWLRLGKIAVDSVELQLSSRSLAALGPDDGEIIAGIGSSTSFVSNLYSNAAGMEARRQTKTTTAGEKRREERKRLKINK